MDQWPTDVVRLGSLTSPLQCKLQHKPHPNTFSLMVVKWLKQLPPSHPHAHGPEGATPATHDQGTISSQSRSNPPSTSSWPDQITCPFPSPITTSGWVKPGYLTRSPWERDRSIWTRSDKAGLNLGAWESTTPTTNQEKNKIKPWLLPQCGRNGEELLGRPYGVHGSSSSERIPIFPPSSRSVNMGFWN